VTNRKIEKNFPLFVPYLLHPVDVVGQGLADPGCGVLGAGQGHMLQS